MIKRLVTCSYAFPEKGGKHQKFKNWFYEKILEWEELSIFFFLQLTLIATIGPTVYQKFIILHPFLYHLILEISMHYCIVFHFTYKECKG